MLTLESPRWAELQHAYGNASDIPRLLRQLETFPVDGQEEPWQCLWGSLCHQGTVYEASFASVPHIVRILGTDPVRAGYQFFQLPARIEIGRVQQRFEIPIDLQEAYFFALRRLPALAGAAAVRDWNSDFLRCVLSAIAAVKGSPPVAEAVEELTPEVATEFLEWFFHI